MSRTVEQRVADALGGLREQAGPQRPSTITLDGVRRAGAARRRRTRVLGAAAAAVVVAGSTALLSSLGTATTGTTYLGPPATAPAGPGLTAPAGPPLVATAVPVPGIDPAFVPTHGRDWLLTEDEERAFTSTHALPSPGPGQGVVASPAPLRRDSALLEEHARAGLPPGARIEREDDASGQPGTAALHVELTDGTLVEVRRERLPVPGWAGPGTGLEQDLPGSSSAAVMDERAGYGWPGGRPPDARLVRTVTADGVLTTWYAELTVSLDTVLAWAVAADRAASGEPS